MSSFESCEYLVVGAGIWGSVIAERIASQKRQKVTVIDRREHIGGNCHSKIDPETDIECHVYGTHIFHTKKRHIWDYVNKFTGFNTYRHKVLTEYKGKVYPMPIGLETINSYYGLTLKPYEAENFIRTEAAKECIAEPRNLEEKAISLIGRPLYEAFIKGYTQKQWNKPPAELPAEIITRLPVRSNYNFDYFDDDWQGMPLKGYSGLFDAMLTHENITVRLGLDYKHIVSALPDTCQVFYSGAIDEFFDYQLGELEWRSLRFEEEIIDHPDYQGIAVMNQADASVPFTRTHEYRHLHPERAYTSPRTVIVREYPQNYTSGAERYYPLNTARNQELFRQYQALAKAKAPGVVFGGRLGSYRYLDMDMAIGHGLETFAVFSAC